MGKTVLLIFGGNSSESDISVISGVEALRAMPGRATRTIPIYIKNGIWYTGESLYNIKFYKSFDAKQCKVVRLVGRELYMQNVFHKFKPYCDVDCALLCTHGGDGEDGALQGFLELSGVPFSSSSSAACALMMDKFATKTAVRALGVPVVQGRAITANATEGILELLEELYNYPMMVKPIAQGSSIGVTCAKNREELIQSLALAEHFGNRAIVERGLRNFKELNCAAVRIGGNIILSGIESPLSAGDFLSFDDKYGTGTKGMTTALREFPAKVPENIAAKVRKYTEVVYSGLGLSGIVRMDYLLEDDELFLNEINAIPGSLAHYLFGSFTYTELLSAVIGETLQNGLPKRYALSTGVFGKIPSGIKI